MAATFYTDGADLNNVGPGTFGPFALAGGNYGLSAIFGASATIQIQKLFPAGDGRAAINMTPAGLASATPYASVYLPPGSFQVVIGTAASSLSITKVKGGV